VEESLAQIAGYASLAFEAMALVFIAIGCVEAFVAGLRVQFSPRATGHDRRAVWLRFSRWLVAGLTFQLAGDIVHSAIAPTWDEIGKLASIAAIRTFLNFFLERDLAEVREREQAPEQSAA
jgi:uncharacterized membrane protein